MSERPDIWKVADALQMDLRSASAKNVQLRALLSSVALPDCPSCPHCGYRSAMNMPSVSDHIKYAHQL